MKGQEQKRYEMLVRVREFGAAHRSLFPRSEKGGEAFAQVAAAVDALTAENIAQLNGHGSAQEGTTNKELARDALRESLLAITQTARAMAIDRPGLARKFQRPVSVGDRGLLARAQLFVDDATPLKAEFVAHAMPANFLTTLRTRIAEFEEAISDQQQGKDARLSATVGIAAALASGMEAAKRLDAIVRNRLRDDAQARAVWARARRIGEPVRTARRLKPSASTPSPAPAPVVAPVVEAPQPAPAEGPAPASNAVT